MAAKILIVDDEPIVREYLGTLLVADGYELTEAGTLAALRARFQDLAPDVILLDLHLPDGHGLSVLPEIKKTWPACRVVILTGHASVEGAAEEYKLHDVFLLTKPIDAEMLRTVLALALASRRVET